MIGLGNYVAMGQAESYETAVERSLAESRRRDWHGLLMGLPLLAIVIVLLWRKK